jgi:hypothetical protein
MCEIILSTRDFLNFIFSAGFETPRAPTEMTSIAEAAIDCPGCGTALRGPGP